ncbi:hypothetical protein [Gallid alphaherpesvirus 2]|uniref:Uncharacterized protein n=1 Tax=Gallid alphaherpesvirus 2 TaxID=10390 RepID=I6TBG2_9ALPH|nr:hypothetical protein [Gallid alphaherpesvirus 2]AFM75232.1 hypothetical protein [Gallid alphaherpesvirus 2]AFM75274.1 hypothetical protein [Gallid alphaherpesvirus 2]AFM75415.1 hypothetical protein [Gallid alphaherpesvirus 2]
MNDRGVPNSRTGPSLLALLPAANSYAAAYSPANRRAVGVGGGSYKSPTRGSPGTRGGWKAPLCLTLIGGIDGTVAALPPPAVYSLTFSGLGEPPQGAPRRGGGGADAGERTERGSTANKKKNVSEGSSRPHPPWGPRPQAAVGRHPPLPPRRVRLCQPRRRPGDAARGPAPPAEQHGSGAPGATPAPPCAVGRADGVAPTRAAPRARPLEPLSRARGSVSRPNGPPAEVGARARSLRRWCPLGAARGYRGPSAAVPGAQAPSPGMDVWRCAARSPVPAGAVLCLGTLRNKRGHTCGPCRA